MTLRKFKVLLFMLSILLIFQIYKNLRIPGTVGLEEGRFVTLKDTPNGVSSQTEVADKKVEAFEMNTSVNKAKKHMKGLILSYDNTKLIKESYNYLHFVFTTDFFHFKDDVEFYFDSEHNIIHFKSQSRIGYSDMGMNKNRYQMIKKDFHQ